MLNQKGLVIPIILALSGILIISYALFFLYTKKVDNKHVSSTTQNTIDIEPTISSVSDSINLPLYTNSTFIKKQIVNICKNIDSLHTEVPICSSLQYTYLSSVSTDNLHKWISQPENTKSWSCSGVLKTINKYSQIFCTNDKNNKIEVILNPGTESNTAEVIYKILDSGNFSYQYKLGWKTVISQKSMFSYPETWVLDESDLKSPDFEMKPNTPGAPILANGCIIKTSNGLLPDESNNQSLKSETYPFFGDSTAKLHSWQDQYYKTYHFQLNSLKLSLTLEVANSKLIDQCKGIFLQYAKSFKMIEEINSDDVLRDNVVPEFVLLESE